MFSPSGVNASCTLLKSQSLAAKPPTRTTCWGWERGDCQKHNARYRQDTTNRNRFMGALSLIQYCLDNAIHRRFKKRSNISPKWTPLTTNDVSLEKSLAPWASTGRSECYRPHHYPEWTQIWYTELLQLFWSVVSSFYQNIEWYDQDRPRMANLPGNLDRRIKG